MGRFRLFSLCPLYSMSLLENQSFRKKISFVKSDDNDKVLTFTIVVQSNHDIDKTILGTVEKTINEMLLNDYEDSEVFEAKKKKLKEEEQKNALIMKEQKILQAKYKKQQEQMKQEIEKMKLRASQPIKQIKKKK